ncbi:MAG: hypothetical protein IJQ67_03960 [Bacilli bacterium]|nr:hypothetical protein [Bacilli bacterium]
MNEKEIEIREYFTSLLNKKIHSTYKKEDRLLGDVYFFNDAYVIKDYHKEELPLLSLERMKTVYEILDSEKMCEKVIVIDEYHKRKVTKVVHGDVGYLDEVNESQVRNVARLLKKLHKHVSEYDVPMDIVSDLYRFKEDSSSFINKILENRIIREVNNIKDKTPIGLCHNLLNKDNVIYRLENALLINYELSNVNYTYFDLAFFIHENIKSINIKEEFLKTYFGASFNSLKEKRVDIFIRFVSLYYYYYYQSLYKITNDDRYLKLIKKEETYLKSLI